MSLDSERRYEEFRVWKRDLEDRCNLVVNKAEDEIAELEDLYRLPGPGEIKVVPSVGGSYAVYCGDFCFQDFWGDGAEGEATQFAYDLLFLREVLVA